MTKRLLFLTAIFMFVMFGLQVHATSGYWSSYASSSFAGGDGSKEKPYEIGTAEQLAYFAQEVNAGNNYSGMYIKLIADIDLSDHYWVPIGIGNNSVFGGCFDGKWKSIDGVFIGSDDSPTSRYIGFFGCVRNESATNPTVIENLLLKSGSIIGSGTYTAGVVGFVSSKLNTLIVSNCINYCDILGGSPNRLSSTGGIISYAALDDTGQIMISNCINYGDIRVREGTQSTYTGGILGYSNGYGSGILTVARCYAVGDIHVPRGCVGGLVGDFFLTSESSAKLVNSYALVNIKGGNGNKPESAGGLMGKFYSSSTSSYKVDSCFVLINSIEAEIDVHRVVGSLHNYFPNWNAFGVEGNYAWADEQYTWSNIGAKDLDGADWNAKMTRSPVALWDTDVWSIDPANRYMPKLKSIPADLQKNVENPTWVDNTVNISSEESEVSCVKGMSGYISVENAKKGSSLKVYNLSGVLVDSRELQYTNNVIHVDKGIYLVTLDNETVKVPVK